MPDLKSAPVAAPAPAPTVVGPYEILGELGSGGMGRVFRARDSRLQRDVAIKMLHGTDDDARRVQRFLAEARAAGALNHPNILAVYDVGTDGSRPYLVSELIDGTSLRRELDSGAMPMSRVLDLAVQIADGLAAAHQARLVHRDLKPENVMVSRGRAKIVDFGLAKDAGPFDGDGTTVRTMTAAHTILGTPPYMSPEQARGAPVDYRSDQFSFGAMVYEMATGRRAFERPTPIETLTAIQHDEPPRMREVNPRVPLRLQQIVERCLAKVADGRYASTADLRHDLRDLSEGRVSTDTASTPDVALRLPWWRLRAVRIGVGIASVAVAALVGALTGTPGGRDLSQYRIVPVATDAAYEGSPAWSPNGQSLAYIAERGGILQVMARALDSSRSIQLTSAVSDCRSPMWSGDGSRVFYISLAGSEDSVWSVSAAGGTPRLEIRNVANAAMSGDGRTLVFLREEGTLWSSSPPGQEPVRFAQAWRGTLNASVSEVRLSPDGTKVGLWSDDIEAVDGRQAFWVFDYPSGRVLTVLRSLSMLSRAHPFAWMADNRRIVFGADQLGRSPGSHLWVVDTESGTLAALTASSTSEYEPSVSPDGTRIAFVSETSHYDVAEVPLSGTGFLPRTSSASDDSDPVWLPTGRQYAYVTNRSGVPEIWLADIDGAVEVPLVTRRNFQDRSYLLSRPAVSPDGQRLAFQRKNSRGYYLWTVPTAGGQAVPTTTEQSTTVDYSDAATWSPSGEWIAFIYTNPLDAKDPNTKQIWRLGKARPGANEEVIEVQRDVNYLTAPQWSPDGRWITVELADGLYAVSPDPPAERAGPAATAPQADSRRLISRDPWLVHTWAKDSKSILAIRQSDDYRLQLASIDVATQAVRVLNPDLGPVPPTTPPLRGFSLSPDGTRLLTSIARLRGDIHILDGFQQDDSLWGRVRRLFGSTSGEDSMSPP